MLSTRARKRSQPANLALSENIRMNVYYRRGQLEQAAAAGGAAVAADPLEAGGTLPGTSGYWAAVLAAMGRLDEAAAALELPGGAEAWAPTATFHGYLIGQSRMFIATGDYERAYRSAVRCGTLASVMGTINPAVLPWRSLAVQAAVELGRADQVVGLAEENLHLARRFGEPSSIATGLQSLARVRQADHAVELLHEAAACFARSPDRLTDAAVQHDLAHCLGRLGRTTEAVEAAERGIQLARACGAAPLAGITEALAAQLRASPRPKSPVSSPEPRLAALEVRALGEFAVLAADGAEVTPGGTAGRAVRVIIGAGRPLHVEELGDLLWPDVTDARQVRARLRNVIHRAQTAAGPLLVRRGEVVSLRTDVTVDADRFEAAAKAVLDHADARADMNEAMTAAMQYGGDLLPSDPFADWATSRRERLRSHFLALSDLACRLAAEAGMVDLAVNLAEAAIRYDPYDDQRLEFVAAVLDRAGRAAAARAMSARAARVRERLGL